MHICVQTHMCMYMWIYTYLWFICVCMYVCIFILSFYFDSYISVKFDISCYMKHLTAELIYLKKRVFVYIIYKFSLKTVFYFKLYFIFAFYHVVYIVHSPWLWSVTSTYFQIRANVFYLFLYRLEIKFYYSYSYYALISNNFSWKYNMTILRWENGEKVFTKLSYGWRLSKFGHMTGCRLSVR